MALHLPPEHPTDIIEIDRVPPRLPELVGERKHGDARRAWSEEFLRYAYALIDDPAYAGMPCTVDSDGKLDWTIPSNRSKGSKNWDGNSQRREWWRLRAAAEGISLDGKWLSDTAKKIHPWGWKPCQTCGRWMRIAYAYPGARTLAAINESLPSSEQVAPEDLLDIFEIVEHLDNCLGSDAETALKLVFPEISSYECDGAPAIKTAIYETVVSKESRRLSPGAMSNAPDRLDGFHTYNLCCRSSQDTGRFSANLKSYSIDRRAFEHWAEGDWEAASSLMSTVGIGECPVCHETLQLSADHVGPISLGFKHIPHFLAVCKSCNSAKNNRMSLSDVEWLRALEQSGESVISWHAGALWRCLEPQVTTDELAKRASAILNVNQREFFRGLLRMLSAGIPDAMLQFLHPEFALERITFDSLDPRTLTYSEIERSPRQRTFALSKASRMVRIAFDSLDEYDAKGSRRVPEIPHERLADAAALLDEAIAAAVADPSPWRDAMVSVIPSNGGSLAVSDLAIEKLFEDETFVPGVDYEYLRDAFEEYMRQVAELLCPRIRDAAPLKEWPAVSSQSAIKRRLRPPEA